MGRAGVPDSLEARHMVRIEGCPLPFLWVLLWCPPHPRSLLASGMPRPVLTSCLTTGDPGRSTAGGAGAHSRGPYGATPARWPHSHHQPGSRHRPQREMAGCGLGAARWSLPLTVLEYPSVPLHPSVPKRVASWLGEAGRHAIWRAGKTMSRHPS